MKFKEIIFGSNEWCDVISRVFILLGFITGNCSFLFVVIENIHENQVGEAFLNQKRGQTQAI
jgi:hypothetical protein